VIVSKPKALVLNGDGINCEAETKFALETSGFEAAYIHTSELLKEPTKIKSIQLLVLPGGFSFGDEIASGKVLAIKLKEHLNTVLHEFIDQGSLLLGLCNGFQVLVQMGILPPPLKNKSHIASLIHNQSAKFSNHWVGLTVNPSVPCQFLQSLETIELPIRHGEGRLVIDDHSPEIRESVKRHACLHYQTNVNGSFERIAGLTNSQGNVLGMMPHPEGFIRWTQHPAWTSKRRLQNDCGDGSSTNQKTWGEGLPDGLAILTSAFNSLR
jgi:phosphoribosylformylglycinamidine synthase subunit PurQ / glutaminase